jgi:hypothetical protein
MTSVAHLQSEPPDHEELVAYLDGELPPEDCRVVEERLASDAEYRQQLRDLDQAWEALGALPTTAVDDGFARTTIELACVAAQEDLSQRTALAAVEDRSRKRWWIAGGVAAALIGFIMVRALAAHRNNALLADLPVIQQASVLAQVESVDFLRQLAKAVPRDEFVKEDAAFQRDLKDFTAANSESFEERRNWIDSLSPEQKANLAERARAFEEVRQAPEEKDRQRKLANDIRREPELQQTLIAFGQWLSHHTPGQQEQLREATLGLSTSEKVARIQQRVHQEYEQAARHLPAADEATLRREILELAKEERSKLLQRPAGPERDRIEGLDVSKAGAALWILREAIQNNEYGEEAMDRLVGTLSQETQDHWKRLGRRRRERWFQLWQWIHDALQPTWGPEKLERFFTSDKLTPDERQKLLDMPRTEMKNELEKLYLGSEVGIDNRLPFIREFGDGGRGPRNRLRPPDEPFRRGGPPGESRLDRDRRPGGGPRGPGPEDRFEGGQPNDRPRQPPNDRPPPQGGPPI